jgi:hypothetical protein
MVAMEIVVALVQRRHRGAFEVHQLARGALVDLLGAEGSWRRARPTATNSKSPRSSI